MNSPSLAVVRFRGAVMSVAAVALGALAMTGCARNVDGADGECGARLAFDRVTYRPLATPFTPRRGAEVGRSAYVGCTGEPAGVGRPVAYRVAGVDATRALMVHAPDGDSVYVAEDLPRRSWPAPLRAADRAPRCAPITFTGSWDVNLTDTEPGGSVFDLAAPYVASFTTRGGPGFDFATWSAVTLTARVTDRTAPMPDAATVREAVAGHAPVEVRAACRGGAFVVRSVELLR